MYPSLRKVLFGFDAEKVHERSSVLLRTAMRVPPLRLLARRALNVKDRRLQLHKAGLHFANPVGLAAGFDKNGRLAFALDALGFGFGEVGTVTLRPQAGNDPPRLWRLPEEQALINRMGFNNRGADALVETLQAGCRRVPVGVNIGLNKATAEAAAKSSAQSSAQNMIDAEYCTLLDKVYCVADYVVVNVSSPNTPGLRDLQEPQRLEPLLGGLLEEGRRLALREGCREKPLLVKFAPELTDAVFDDLLGLLRRLGIPGLVVSNTLKTERGGKSGPLLRDRATSMVRQARRRLGEETLIIGVGGIDKGRDVERFLAHGADVVQLYTGWIYQGPLLLPRINRYLLRRMKELATPDLNAFAKVLRSGLDR